MDTSGKRLPEIVLSDLKVRNLSVFEGRQNFGSRFLHLFELSGVRFKEQSIVDSIQ
jgi:hypothetical protein